MRSGAVPLLRGRLSSEARGSDDSRKLCQKACCARSLRCQPQDVLFVLLANDGEAALLQDPSGGDVVLGNTCIEGAAHLHAAKKYRERLRGDPPAPVLP